MANEILTLKNVKVKHKVIGLTDTVTDALKGELFLSEVTGSTVDPHTGDVIAPTYVARVGTGELAVDSDENPVLNSEGKQISELSWLHAPASDVYAWAKEADFDAAFNNHSTVLATRLTDIEEAVGLGTGGSGDTSLPQQLAAIDARVSSINAALGSVEDGKLVTGFTYTAATEGSGESLEVNVIDADTYLTQSAFDNFYGTVDDTSDFKTFASVSDAITTFLADAEISTAAIDTLKELQDWITEHGTEADEVFSQVTTNTNAIGAVGQSGTILDNISLLQTGLGTANTAIDNLQAEFAANGRVTIAESDIDSLETAVGTINDTGIFFSKVDSNVTISKLAGVSATESNKVVLILDCND